MSSPLPHSRPAHLFVELVHDAFRPLEVEVATFGGPVDVCQLNADLAHEQPVILVGPVNSWTVHIIHLFVAKHKHTQLFTFHVFAEDYALWHALD